ncbi:universal stress protein [Crenobacter sp. SG2303]|uniref:Universal stress protein n=1 Tax=Crenobacter oryzisoli TaxID=3056844 RepID=A0ABT7XI97_9NEIS|nr:MULTISPECIES: universal stress protein [unclassified Crenobacter]MDN0073519.1 universal stress protein [Crenobacter sp. SG2303]MDN0081951.1 universal stress protein [Crenobacter sp. SG2305]
MSYQSILVHVDSSPDCINRVELAASLAQRFGAHLTGIFTTWLPTLEASMAEAPLHDVTAAAEKYAEKYAKQAKATFDKVIHAVGIDNIEWRQSIDSPIEALCLHARYHDLVILGQRNPDKHIDNLPRDFVQAVVLGAGRPVLVVPYLGSFTEFGKRALVGWDAGRESIRALTDALPLLKRAQKTSLQTFNAKQFLSHQGELPGSDISLFLARHGVEVELLANINGVNDVGGLLLSTAADVDADFLVMGAYGHSRLVEIMLGGATKTVLESMTVPVLMSH